MSEKSAKDFCKKFFTRKPNATIVAHVHSADDLKKLSSEEEKITALNSLCEELADKHQDARSEISRSPELKEMNDVDESAGIDPRGKVFEDDVLEEKINKPFDVKYVVKTAPRSLPENASTSHKSVEKVHQEEQKAKEIVTVRRRNVVPPKPMGKSYITAMDTWQHSSIRIICNKCGKRGRPLLRTYTRRLTTSKTGAAWILTCWPLICFLPCLTRSVQQQFLYCSRCDCCLGEFQEKI